MHTSYTKHSCSRHYPSHKCNLVAYLRKCKNALLDNLFDIFCEIYKRSLICCILFDIVRNLESTLDVDFNVKRIR